MPAIASDYQGARRAFLDAAAAAGGALTHHGHPASDPDDGPLATDVAVFGPPDAPSRLLVISGTHGVEGFAGSLCQSEWLRDGVALPDGLAVVLVHAINPYGFAWVRRVNEDNVDLNRNCVDFAAALPENPGYDELAGALVPSHWDATTQAATADELLAFATAYGFDALQAAVSGGQYRHPRGIFYGGAAPVWSRRTLEAVVRTHLADATDVAIIDLHTGLGPFGHGELIASHPDADARQRLDACFDGYVVPSEGTSVSADVQGDVLDGMEAWLPGVGVAGVAIEWGTVDIVEVSTALRADAWLHGYDDPRGREAPGIKAQLRAAFAPDDPRWADLVLERFVEVRDRAVAGLLGS
ncbi:MAG: M14 family metallopeptidase [Acidimicrobiia bacterium]